MILSDVCEIKRGKDFKNFSKEKTEQLQVPIMGIGGIVGYTDKCMIDRPVIAISIHGGVGKVKIYQPPCAISDNHAYLIPDPEKVDFLYLYAYLKEFDYTRFTIKSLILNLDVQAFKKLQIPDLPPERQKIMGLKYHMRETLKILKNVMLDPMSLR